MNHLADLFYPVDEAIVRHRPLLLNIAHIVGLAIGSRNGSFGQREGRFIIKVPLLVEQLPGQKHIERCLALFQTAHQVIPVVGGGTHTSRGQVMCVAIGTEDSFDNALIVALPVAAIIRQIIGSKQQVDSMLFCGMHQVDDVIQHGRVETP